MINAYAILYSNPLSTRLERGHTTFHEILRGHWSLDDCTPTVDTAPRACPRAPPTAYTVTHVLVLCTVQL